MVARSLALHRHVEKADPQRDRRVESIKVPEDHVWGAENDTTPLVSTSNRVLVVCGGSNAIVPTSPGQVGSKDHCADVVALFPHANTPKKVEA
ncbi:BZ3500_MvSof-1268-A1-R1_Chr3-3g06609 [Microbotryum saponariae]|uniref:BZ3500_MvSof-1268-A1-R1_Chr3-3g06609 protein n=1 Tax=Microbotryum saponariae TaxID=289078 RepID=A0A2X0NGE6_9BASI|nr:BZ3500_MvSof-1268-A1-R1_Chr3-3g06609 [Microbotryum saponariae]SDA04576.1 BZ3501_MvSof-1269-A2-R1_Chr3-2g06296 [Microbotryum saponariae]